MVESNTKRDLAVQSRIAYIGDDTGLIKKVKVVAKRVEQVKEVKYDAPKMKKREGNEKPTFYYTRRSTLGASDNQAYVKA
jgi:hypothetical protein